MVLIINDKLLMVQSSMNTISLLQSLHLRFIISVLLQLIPKSIISTNKQKHPHAMALSSSLDFVDKLSKYAEYWEYWDQRKTQNWCSEFIKSCTKKTRRNRSTYISTKNLITKTIRFMNKIIFVNVLVASDNTKTTQYAEQLIMRLN